MNKKIAVTGFRGRLGSALIAAGCEPFDCDITSHETIIAEYERVKPNLIINCAAISDVDRCEKEKNLAYKVNTLGPDNLRYFLPKECQIFQISTPYVFGGTKRKPYTEKDIVKPHRDEPLQEYGWTKWAGEAIFGVTGMPNDCVIRVAGLYGKREPVPVRDFVEQAVHNLGAGDQFFADTENSFNPTYIPHLVLAILALADKSRLPKILHLGGRSIMNRYQFARLIAETYGFDKTLVWPQKSVAQWIAPRPKNASMKLNLAESIGLPIFGVEEGLMEYGHSIGIS